MLTVKTKLGEFKVNSSLKDWFFVPENVTGVQKAEIKAQLKKVVLPESGVIYVDAKSNLPYERIGKIEAIVPLTLREGTFTRNEATIH